MNKKVNKKISRKNKGKKKIQVQLICIFTLLLTVVLIFGVIQENRTQAYYRESNEELVKLVNVLKDSGYTADESEKILKKVYPKYYIKADNNELVVCEYQTNDETVTILRMDFR